VAKEKDQKERDWDKEMAQVDRLLAKLPDADPTLGRGVPTVPVSPRSAVGGGAAVGSPTTHTGPARGRAWITTWMRVGLGLALGVGMLVWPYARCGPSLIFYLSGATAVMVAGVWSALTSWKRRLGIAHTLSILLIIWGLALAGRQLLPRIYGETPVPFSCPRK
jgi:hypothetical protein